MITLQDVKEIQRYVNEENYRRGIFRPDLTSVECRRNYC
jgi:hypothetical protein